MHLSTEKLGQSVDECDALLKKHEAFERLITSQEEKVKKFVIHNDDYEAPTIEGKGVFTNLTQMWFLSQTFAVCK